MTPPVDPKTAALLVMDFQTAVVEMIAIDQEGLLARTAALIDAARHAEVRVVYVVVAFRDGYPEVSARNASFGRLKGGGLFLEGSPSTQVHAAVAPKPGEPVVTKRRVSAFAGTDLEMILRAKGVDTLILAGLATSGVVLSTVRHAADADYRLVVVEDCCGDRDAEVHRVLMDKVFARQATVTQASDVIAALRG
ncbi:MAG TPA: isochorismatase family cysteine hydrolase [Polyangiaceae bacterium]|nr:isochorismatase family cysteine hydrolase [Polyangiaceae bacterium]